MKTALITGIAGQDGSYLAELLLSKGYKVHGLVKSLSTNSPNAISKISHIFSSLVLHRGDIADYKLIYELIGDVQPDEIYHLATEHDLADSLENYLAIRAANIDGTYYFFFASSSRIFGRTLVSPQNEETVCNPNSLYAISKTTGMYFVKIFRDQHNIFACSGILYNHESPRRDYCFLSRKITSTAVKIKLGFEKELRLGDLEARQDWGFAGDYVEAMWRILQADKPKDYVIGTGISYSVKDILHMAFSPLGLHWEDYVVVDKELMRKNENHGIVADISRIRDELGWQPITAIEEVIGMMVNEDLRNIKRNQ